MEAPRMKIGSEWIMLIVVGVVSLVVELLRIAARGGPWTPAGLIVQHLSRAVLTGVVTAGVWAALDIKWDLPPTASVAVAVTVTMLGVDLAQSLLRRYAEKRLGLTPEEEGKP